MISSKNLENHVRGVDSPAAAFIFPQNEDLSKIEKNNASEKSILYNQRNLTNFDNHTKEKKKKRCNKKKKPKLGTRISQPEYICIKPYKDEFIVAEIEISSDEDTNLVGTRNGNLYERTNSNSNHSIRDEKDPTLLQLNNKVLIDLPNQDLSDEIKRHKVHKTKKYHNLNTSDSKIKGLRKKKKVKQLSIFSTDKVYTKIDSSCERVKDILKKRNNESNTLDLPDLLNFPPQSLKNIVNSATKSTKEKYNVPTEFTDINKQKYRNINSVLKNPASSNNYRSKTSHKKHEINRSKEAIKSDECTKGDCSSQNFYDKVTENVFESPKFPPDFILKKHNETQKMKKRINKNKMDTPHSYLFEGQNNVQNICNSLERSSTKSLPSTKKFNEKRLIAKFVRQPKKLTTTSKGKTTPKKSQKKINPKTEDTASVFSWQYVLTERKKTTKNKNKTLKPLPSGGVLNNKTNRKDSVKRNKKKKTKTEFKSASVVNTVKKSDVQYKEESNISSANNLILTPSKSMPYLCPLAEALENPHEPALNDIEDTFSWANISSRSESMASVAYNAKTSDTCLYIDGRAPRVILRDIGNDLHKYKIYGQRNDLANESSSESSEIEYLSKSGKPSDCSYKPVNGFPKQRIPLSPLNLSISTISSRSLSVSSRCSKSNRHDTQNETRKQNKIPLRYSKKIKENEKVTLKAKSITDEINLKTNDEHMYKAIKQAFKTRNNYSANVKKDERRIDISEYSKECNLLNTNSNIFNINNVMKNNTLYKMPIENVTYQKCHEISNKKIPPVKRVVSELFNNLYKRVKSTLTSIERRSKKSDLNIIVENKHCNKISETSVVNILDIKCDDAILSNKSVACNLAENNDLERKCCDEIEICRKILKKDVDFMKPAEKKFMEQNSLVHGHQDMLPKTVVPKIEANCDSDIISLYADSFDAQSFCSAASIKTEFPEQEEKPPRTFIENHADDGFYNGNSKAVDVKVEDRFSYASNVPFVAPLIAPHHLIYLKDSPAVMSPTFRLSILFKGVCVNNIIKSCPGETCKYPHETLSEKVIYDRLVQLQVLRFVDEYVHLRGHDSLYKIHLRLYFYVCYQKGLPNLLLEMMFDSAVFRMPDWVELAQIGLQLLNRADLERCKFFLLLYVQQKVFSELLLNVIVDSGNFIKYKDIFVKLSFVLITTNSAVPIDLFSKILENVNVVPLDHDLLCAVYELLKNTPRSIFRSQIMDNFLQRLEEHKMFFNLVMDLKRFAISRMDSFSHWANHYNIKMDFDNENAKKYVMVSTFGAKPIIKTALHDNQAKAGIKSENMVSRLRGKTRWDVVNHSATPLKDEERTAIKDEQLKEQCKTQGVNAMDNKKNNDKQTDCTQLPVEAGSNTEILRKDPTDEQITKQEPVEGKSDLCKRLTREFGSSRKISASDIWEVDSDDEVEQKRRKFDRYELERPTPEVPQENFPPRTTHMGARRNQRYCSNRSQNNAGPRYAMGQPLRYMNTRF